MKFIREWGSALAGLAALLTTGCSVLNTEVKLEATAVATETATLMFTATDMRKGQHGYPIGVGSLIVSTADDFQCRRTPRSMGNLNRVSAHQPTVSIQVPAGQALILDSSWAGADSICIVGNKGFLPRGGEVYRVTNTQNAARGTCVLKLERLDRNKKRFVAQPGLRALPRTCQARSGKINLAGNDPYDYR